MVQKIRYHLLRSFFHLLYSTLAPLYDVVAWTVSLGQWNSWVERALPFIEGTKILELGHGPGHLQKQLAEHYAISLGIDKSWQMIMLAARRLIRAKLPCNLIHGDVQALPIPNHFFDTIVSTFPSEYIINPLTLLEAKRVLTHNGLLIVVPSAFILPISTKSRFLSWILNFAGQSTNLHVDWQTPFIAAGFLLQDHHVMRDAKSVVHILLFRVPSSIPEDAKLEI